MQQSIRYKAIFRATITGVTICALIRTLEVVACPKEKKENKKG
jgi:hypothetical protein